MRIDFFGGFGEKGRTSIGVSASKNIMLDAGIKVGASGRDYYPLINENEIKELDAVFISHAHEDHIGGLNWLLYYGFNGTIYMTRETLDDAEAMLSQYADPDHRKAYSFSDKTVKIFTAGDNITIGDMVISSGRSGHVAGGVWFSVKAENKTIVYCADVVPESNVFLMDQIPECDLLIVDASYGGDTVSAAERSRSIQVFLAENPSGCLLPVPLSGKPLELMAIMPERFAIHSSMRQSLALQIEVPDALSVAMVTHLRKQLGGAIDWSDDEPFPDCPLLTHDGMGSSGPSVSALQRASDVELAVLLTGHVPENTIADRLVKNGTAKWIRMPTHPTGIENKQIWELACKPAVYGHSCTLTVLKELKPNLTDLNTTVVSGSHLTI